MPPGVEAHPYVMLDLAAGTRLYMKWVGQKEWLRCKIARSQPSAKKKQVALWRGWYVLDFEQPEHQTSQAFDLLALARDGRIRFHGTRSPGGDNNGEDDKDEEEEAETEDEVLDVEEILGKKVQHGGIRYKVRWKGYGQSDDTCVIVSRPFT